tara:strand:+ start:36 stop:512 length:477 start_codon:yes stop_codon:yes gene_type:complete
MELPNELIIKIINYCDNKTLLNFKTIHEFNIFKKDIDKNIYKNSIIEWKYIQYQYIKTTLRNKIFEDMKKIHMLTFGFGDLGPVVINYPFDNYKIYFDNYWNNEIDIILDSTDFKQIKIDKIIIELKKGLPELRIKYSNYFYRFPTNVLCKVYFDERF